MAQRIFKRDVGNILFLRWFLNQPSRITTLNLVVLTFFCFEEWQPWKTIQASFHQQTMFSPVSNRWTNRQRRSGQPAIQHNRQQTPRIWRKKNQHYWSHTEQAAARQKGSAPSHTAGSSSLSCPFSFLCSLYEYERVRIISFSVYSTSSCIEVHRSAGLQSETIKGSTALIQTFLWKLPIEKNNQKRRFTLDNTDFHRWSNTRGQPQMSLYIQTCSYPRDEEMDQNNQ